MRRQSPIEDAKSEAWIKNINEDYRVFNLDRIMNYAIFIDRVRSHDAWLTEWLGSHVHELPVQVLFEVSVRAYGGKSIREDVGCVFV